MIPCPQLGKNIGFRVGQKSGSGNGYRCDHRLLVIVPLAHSMEDTEQSFRFFRDFARGRVLRIKRRLHDLDQFW